MQGLPNIRSLRRPPHVAVLTPLTSYGSPEAHTISPVCCMGFTAETDRRLTVGKGPDNSLSGIFFFYCMFYQFLRVQHSCSSTQSWGSVLPSIVEKRDQNSWGCPLLFSIGIWDLGQKSYTLTAFGKLWTTPGVRCIIHASS